VDTKDFKEIPYTIQMNLETGTVWLNNHVSKEKIVVTEKDFHSIENCFLLINAKKKGLL